MDLIENRTFDEFQIGESASLARTLTNKDIELFAIMSGDVNPAHVDAEFAKSDMFHKIVAHGMWGGALISTVLGTELPGPGTIYLGQTLRFLQPVGAWRHGHGIGESCTEAARASPRHLRLRGDQSARRNRHRRYRRGDRAHRENLAAAGAFSPKSNSGRERPPLPAAHREAKGLDAHPHRRRAPR